MKKLTLPILCFLLLWNVHAFAEPPYSFMGVRWGISIDEAREVIKAEAKRVIQDSTRERPPIIYAKGLYLGSQATFSYYFTPKSKKLYCVDATFDNLTMYEKARDFLVKRFQQPTSSKPDRDQWSWDDKTLITLQKEPRQVILSYVSGKFKEMNDQEEKELSRK